MQRMAVSEQRVSIEERPRSPRVESRLSSLISGGTDGNEQLSAITGAVLIVLLAVIGVTILRIKGLLWVHLFIGLLLLGPVALKMASTSYRFIRYYTNNPQYRLKGPPADYLRVLGPLVVLTTVVVFASGVALLLVGPSSRGSLLPIHKISFFVWIAVTAIHVLGHLQELAPALRATRPTRDWNPDAAGRVGRLLSLAGALLAGLLLALLLVPQFTPWLNAHFHHGLH